MILRKTAPHRKNLKKKSTFRSQPGLQGNDQRDSQGFFRRPLFKILEGRAEATWVALPWFQVSRLLNSNIIDHGLNHQICGIAILGPRFHSRFRSVSLFGFYLVCGIAALVGPFLARFTNTRGP